MSAEETELSFVRCGRCRSLVPAIATRCRMCGFVFAEGAKAQEKGEQTESETGRVRQRAVTSESAEDEGTPPPTPATPIKTSETRINKGISESWQVAEQAESENKSATSLVSRAWEAVQEKSPAPSIVAESPKLTIPESVEIETPREEKSEDEVEDWEEAEVSDYEPEEAEDSDEEDSSETKKRRRRRRRRKRLATPFTQESPKSPPVTSRADDLQKYQAPANREYEQALAGIYRSSKTESSPITQIPSERQNMEKPMERQVIQREENSEAVRPAIQTGQLVGWFVDFSQHSTGLAQEIRSGQFFVAKQNLRPNDYVIHSQEISLPHCLVQVDATRGIVVQDLMSERGTYIRRSGEATYQRCYEPVSVRHGDWLRFGSYELMVCTVPSKTP